MSDPLVLLALIALLAGLIEEFRSRGESFAGWGVVALAVGLIWFR